MRDESGTIYRSGSERAFDEDASAFASKSDLPWRRRDQGDGCETVQWTIANDKDEPPERQPWNVRCTLVEDNGTIWLGFSSNLSSMSVVGAWPFTTAAEAMTRAEELCLGTAPPYGLAPSL